VIGSYPKAGGTFSIDEKQTAKKRTVFDNKTVAIIGASGGMGKWFCRLFASEGINVIASGRNQDKINKLSSELGIKAAKSNIDAVKNSDFVLISVLLDDFYGVVKEIAPFTRGKIVIDVTSAKEAPVKTMHELLKGSVVLGTHPLFGPKAEDTNQNFVLTPTNSVENKLAKQFSEWLEDVGFHVSIMRPEKHDRIMAVALTLSHFIGIAAGETWMEFNFEELRNATPSSFKRLLGLVENIADSDPNFYANLQMILPHVSDIEGKFIDNARRLYLIVKNKDEVGFAREMKKLSKSIDKYK
jgi:prephenate dehydrogenase